MAPNEPNNNALGAFTEPASPFVTRQTHREARQVRQMQHASAGGEIRRERERDEESFLDQLTERLCPIPIITYPQDVLLAVQSVPEQKKERKEDSRNISKRFRGGK